MSKKKENNSQHAPQGVSAAEGGKKHTGTSGISTYDKETGILTVFTNSMEFVAQYRNGEPIHHACLHCLEGAKPTPKREIKIHFEGVFVGILKPRG
jgi:hypothetical protein